MTAALAEQTLRPVHERLAERMSTSWSNHLESEVKFEVGAIEIMSASSSSALPENLRVYRFEADPLVGAAWFAFSANLANAYVYRASGGLNGTPDQGSRRFTEEERSQMSAAAIRTAQELEGAWNPLFLFAVHDMNYEPDQPGISNYKNEDTVCVILIANAHDTVYVCYSVSMVEPTLDPKRAKGLWDEMISRIVAERDVWNVALSQRDTEFELNKLKCVTRAVQGLTDQYWLHGGFAVDLLTGRTIRPHQDVDLLVDYDAFIPLAEGMTRLGWTHDRDWTEHHATKFYSDTISVDVAQVTVSAEDDMQMYSPGREHIVWPRGILDPNPVAFDQTFCRTLTPENLVAMKKLIIHEQLGGRMRRQDIEDMERLK
jgi:hypothetical protein